MYQFQQHINLIQNKLYFIHLSLTQKRELNSLVEEVKYFLQNKNGTLNCAVLPPLSTKPHPHKEKDTTGKGADGFCKSYRIYKVIVVAKWYHLHRYDGTAIVILAL